MKVCLLFILLSLPALAESQKRNTIKADVVVIGGGTGGTAAAIQSARLGAKTILAEPGYMLGGMLTAAGVSCTDGNDQLPSGMWDEFRQALYKHYGKKNLNTGWVSNTCFEPHVGDSIFKSWAGKEKKLTVLFGHTFMNVHKAGNKVTGVSIADKEGEIIRIDAKVVIDATETGDVLAASGAAYDLGMDDPAITNEREAREKNNIIQDLTWAAILKDYGPGNDKTIARPPDYDSSKYFCSTADAPCASKPYIYNTKKVLDYGKLPRSPGALLDKYMLNWPAHGNDYYLNVVEQSVTDRNKSYKLAQQHTLGFIYFIQTVLGLKNIGLADDELNGGMAIIPYNREGRRVKGVVRINIHHIKSPYDFSFYRTGISVGDYPVDHHHAQYPGKVPEIEFPPVPAYNIPMGAMIPETIDGLIVCEKGISVSNIVNGTTRLQPVVLLTGQAAGVLAAKSAKLPEHKKMELRRIPVRLVQEELLKAKAYLLPFTDVKPEHQQWEAIQKIGATGILRGTGKAEGWGNKMFFYPDSLVRTIETEENITDYLPEYFKWKISHSGEDSLLTIAGAFSLLEGFYNAAQAAYRSYPSIIGDVFRSGNFEKIWNNIGLKNYQPARHIKRFELAALFNGLLNPFNLKGKSINLQGK